MIPVVRTVLMYSFLLVLLRVSGKRTLAEVTVFDFITLLVMSEATQQALTGNDFSVTNAMIVVLTLVALNRTMDYIGGISRKADRLLNDQPVILIENGRAVDDRLRHNEIQFDDILERARQSQALERLDQIKWAILERDGTISVIPHEAAGSGGDDSGGTSSAAQG